MKILTEKALFVTNSSSRQYGLTSESAACVLTNYPAIKAVIKFRVTLQWIWQVVLTLGREQRRLVWSICLWVGSSKKSEGKMVDELTGKEAWGPLLAANLAEHNSTAVKHICVSMWSFLLLYWQEDNQRYFQGLILQSGWVLGSTKTQSCYAASDISKAFWILNIDEMINAYACCFWASAPLINPHPR